MEKYRSKTLSFHVPAEKCMFFMIKETQRLAMEVHFVAL